jgi:invasion protein IalB
MRCTLAAVLTLAATYASAQGAKPALVKTPLPPTTATPSAEPPLATGAGAAQPAPKTGWASRCASSGRKSDLDCSVEQSVALKTGQIVVQFTVAIQAGGKSPIAIVVLPLGIFLPAGAKAEVDDQKPVDLTLETCDQRGCYAKASVSPDLLSSMKTGKTMTVSFTTMTKETVNIPLQLSEFAEAYGKIE